MSVALGALFAVVALCALSCCAARRKIEAAARDLAHMVKSAGEGGA